MSAFIGNNHINNYSSTNCLPDQNNNSSSDGRTIKDFYRNAQIFVTGGTGFLGKALIEKLLRSCDDIKAVFVLMRPKQGLTSEQRYKEFLKNPVFDRLRSEKPTAVEKLYCLSGDITEISLGLNDNDLLMVTNSVNIVFHSAATVKFNEGLKDAGNLNACGTQRLMELCSKFKYLKAVVHVSTAYCNPGRKYVGEIVYPTVPPIEKDSFIKCIHILPDEILNTVTYQIKGSHPNTYTLTKSIAEQIIQDYSTKFPICIIRPSIVTASIEEPFPGWIDNIQGITGIMMEIGRGTITSILGDKNLICDIIPVDSVVNTMIAAAWSIGKAKLEMVKVFNCTSGQIRPITWENLGKLTMKWARINPSKYVMLYPNFSYRRNKFMHNVIIIVMHYFPAFIFDLFMRFQETKPIMMKIAKKFKSALETGSFFSLNEWIFENKNQKYLSQEELLLVSDGHEFNCNIENLDYDDYIRNYMLGIRKFVLKDGEESMEKARQKLSRIFWIRLIVPVIILIIVVYKFVKLIF